MTRKREPARYGDCAAIAQTAATACCPTCHRRQELLEGVLVGGQALRVCCNTREALAMGPSSRPREAA